MIKNNDFDIKIEKLNKTINEHSNIVFFGGAGVSTESGIPDFRGAEGIYKIDCDDIEYEIKPERILSKGFFQLHPKDFYDFYFKNLIYPNAQPNICHLKLKEMESKNKLTSIVTQNIDDLHEKAGSIKIYKIHGNANSYHCSECKKQYKNNFTYKDNIPVCSCGAILKPDIILYDDNLDEKTWNKALWDVMESDVLIVAGTSLLVYPAASLVENYNGILIIINRSKTPFDNKSDLIFRENIGDVFSKINL